MVLLNKQRKRKPEQCLPFTYLYARDSGLARESNTRMTIFYSFYILMSHAFEQKKNNPKVNPKGKNQTKIQNIFYRIKYVDTFNRVKNTTTHHILGDNHGITHSTL